MIRLAYLFAIFVGLAGCTDPNDLDRAPAELGDFRMGHNISVAPNLTRGPVSREATAEEWIAAMQGAMEERFSRYEGERLYHFGISIEGYVLALPGVPVVASPKSALILKVTVWDDAAAAKLNAKPQVITVLESFSAETVLGSGLTQSKDQQMTNLTRNAAKQIETWMERQKRGQGWFETAPTPDGDKTADGDTES